jgi:hypothetical protein
MTDDDRKPTDEEAVIKSDREKLLDKAADIGDLDPDLLDEEPLDRSYEAVKAMPEEEFIEVAEDALPWLTDEQKAMLRKNR